MANILKSRATDPTDAVFGVQPDGAIFSAAISSGPHWLVCGQTKSGKSVYVNSLLVSMIAHSHPDELKITWIDPKKVEAGAYEGLSYCPIAPVTDMNDAFGLIQYYCYEMDRRYDDLKAAGVKNIAEYQEWYDANTDKAEEMGLQPMYYMVCVIDEYADMVMQNKDVEAGIVRLGQKARAAGIHLIIATQRPSATIVSPTLKANIPGRVCLRVADGTNSLIVIDETGGENLAGYGDSLVKGEDGDIVRVQGPFITNEEIRAIFDSLIERFGPPEPIDFRSFVVEKGLCDWADEYSDDVPPEERHVKPKKRSRL